MSTGTGHDGTNVSVVATGLDSPRGLAFGPEGSLYVAEGGRGGSSATTADDCPQIPGPIGPYSGGFTGRISRIGLDGVRETVIDGLPSSQMSPGAGGLVSGVADVAFVDGMLYALEGGAGCSHGLPGTSNGVYRIEPDRTWSLVADLGAYRRSRPVANPDPNDDEYDGTWFSMVAADDTIFTVEPNHGDVVRAGLDGRVSRVVDLSASYGHIVPAAIAYRDALYVGNLGRFPLVPGASRILRITSEGEITEPAGGLTGVVGLTFDEGGALYALEISTSHEPSRPRPHAGRVVRVGAGGAIEPIAEGLMHPTGMAFGADGALYVSTFGLGPAGAGTILRIALL